VFLVSVTVMLQERIVGLSGNNRRPVTLYCQRRGSKTLGNCGFSRGLSHFSADVSPYVTKHIQCTTGNYFMFGI
jgi:hypothetical protein